MSKMSHHVTITRSTTTTTTSAILINTGYIKTWSGLLKLAETILGAVCVGIVAYYVNGGKSGYYYPKVPELFFLLMTVAFLIGTFCLLLACVLSLSAGTVISKTIYEVIYHGIAFILYIASSLTLLIEVNHRSYRQNEYEPFLAAAIIGLVNTALYLLSTIVAFRSYRLV